MTLPPNTFGDTRTRVLLAVLAGHRSVRGLALATGLSATENVHRHLHRLRDEGLIAFEDYGRGTLRPLVARVA